MHTPQETRHPGHFRDVLTGLVAGALLVLAAPEIANAEQYRCTIDRFCEAGVCKVTTVSADWIFSIEADGSASVFADHKSTPYRKVSETEGSRTFFSDDGGSFPSMRTFYSDGTFIESTHVARPKRARPDEVGPFLVFGTCKGSDP